MGPNKLCTNNCPEEAKFVEFFDDMKKFTILPDNEYDKEIIRLTHFKQHRSIKRYLYDTIILFFEEDN